MNKKPTVLIIHSRYRIRGGEDTAVINEIKLLKQHGHRVLLYERENPGVLFPHSVIFNFKVYTDIKRIIKKKGIDIVHVHNTWMSVSRSVYYAAVSEDVPVVQTLHNFRLVCPSAILYRRGAVCEDCINKGMGAGIVRRCYRGSVIYTLGCALDAAIHKRTGIFKKIYFICLSELNKQILLKANEHGKGWLDPEKIFVKPNYVPERAADRGCSTDKIQCSKHQNEESFAGCYIYAGRLSEEKGIKILIRAWELLGDDAPKLCIYGTGELELWCKEQIKEKNLNAALMGETDHKKLMEAMTEAGALIFPSIWYEGSPMTVIEALSAGTPVIAGDLGNGKQFIKDGINGLLFRSGSARSLADAVKRVTKDNDIFDEKEIRIPEICTGEANYDILEDIYEKLI